jgi:hypothetical protein
MILNSKTTCSCIFLPDFQENFHLWDRLESGTFTPSVKDIRFYQSPAGFSRKYMHRHLI